MTERARNAGSGSRFLTQIQHHETPLHHHKCAQIPASNSCLVLALNSEIVVSGLLRDDCRKVPALSTTALIVTSREFTPLAVPLHLPHRLVLDHLDVAVNESNVLVQTVVAVGDEIEDARQDPVVTNVAF